MRRDAQIDFFLVPDQQLPLHDRLLNWAAYVSPGRRAWPQSAIWRLGKSNGRQWYVPDPRPQIDPLDGQAMEKGVSALPDPHREAIRWHYVYRTGPSKARQALGVTNEGLVRLVVDARSMLINRRV